MENTRAKKEKRPIFDASAYHARANGLLLLRNALCDPPYMALLKLLENIAAAQPKAALESYNELLALLLREDMQRATGDLLLDYILKLLLEKTNRFSELAAARIWDDAITKAMQHDLEALQSLTSLNSAVIKQAIADISVPERESPPRMGAVVWAGDRVAAVNPVGEPKPQPTVSLDNWVDWTYAKTAWVNEYAAGDAINTMRNMLGDEKNWGALVDELWHFHSICGCGSFLKYKTFIFEGSELRGITRETNFSLNDLIGNEQQKHELIKNTMRFVNSNAFQNVLICGEPGSGKTAMALALSGALSSFRMVIISRGEKSNDYAALLDMLSRQPLKFILFYDDIEMTLADHKKLNTMICYGSYDNIMVLGTAIEPQGQSMYAAVLRLESMSAADMPAVVDIMLKKRGVTVRRERIARECENWLSQSGMASFRGAALVADVLEQE